jgi:hypothetical protein
MFHYRVFAPFKIAPFKIYGLYIVLTVRTAFDNCEIFFLLCSLFFFVYLQQKNYCLGFEIKFRYSSANRLKRKLGVGMWRSSV